MAACALVLGGCAHISVQPRDLQRPALASCAPPYRARFTPHVPRLVLPRGVLKGSAATEAASAAAGAFRDGLEVTPGTVPAVLERCQLTVAIARQGTVLEWRCHARLGAPGAAPVLVEVRTRLDRRTRAVPPGAAQTAAAEGRIPGIADDEVRPLLTRAAAEAARALTAPSTPQTASRALACDAAHTLLENARTQAAPARAAAVYRLSERGVERTCALALTAFVDDPDPLVARAAWHTAAALARADLVDDLDARCAAGEHRACKVAALALSRTQLCAER